MCIQTLTGWIVKLTKVAIMISSVAVLAGIDRQHIDDVLYCIDFIEKTITANSVPPCLGLVVLQFLYVLSKMRIVPELRVDVLPKFLGDPFALSLEIP